MFSRKQEFYYLNPCFSSQASKAANKSSFSLRSAVAARSLMRDAAVLANVGAGVVVGKLGTSTITPGELLAAVRDFA